MVQLQADNYNVLISVAKYSYRAAIENLLIKEGYSVLSSETTETLVHEISAFQPHLVILDETLTDDSAEELISSARDFDLGKIPDFLLLTPKKDKARVKKALDQGFSQVLHVPLKPEDLLQNLLFLFHYSERLRHSQEDTLLAYFQSKFRLYENGPLIYFKKINGVSPPFSKISRSLLQWGYLPEEIHDPINFLLEISTTEDKEVLKSHLEELKPGGGPAIFQMQITKANGDVITVIVYLEKQDHESSGINAFYGYLLETDDSEADTRLTKNSAASLKPVKPLSKNEIQDISLPDSFAGMVCKSELLCRPFYEASVNIYNELSILITGESGTGKTTLAEAIHQARQKESSPLINVREKLKEGVSALASVETLQYCTLLLESVETLTLPEQETLLSYFIRMEHSNRELPKIISTSCIDTRELVDQEKIRPELLFRLNSISLRLPRLFDRQEDLPVLVDVFLSENFDQKTIPVVEQSVLDILKCYVFPGNLRELKGILKSALNLAQGGVLKKEHLPAFLHQQMDQNKLKPLSTNEKIKSNSGVMTLAEIEKQAILEAYKVSGNNKSLAARMLGVSLRTLQRKIKNYEDEKSSL